MSKKVIVNKFGGGILKKEYILFIKKRIEEEIKSGYLPIAVVSAMPGVTDKLLSFVENLKENFNEGAINDFVTGLYTKHEIIISDIDLSSEYAEKAKQEIKDVLSLLQKDLNKLNKIDNELEDKIVSFGEKISAIIFNYYLNSSGIKSKKILSEEIKIITDDNFKNANIEYDISSKNILNKLKEEKDVIVIPGFTGITKDGQITTLGRGGTDTTACFIGAALKAHKIILWKDVDGVLSADPKIIQKAKTIPFINYYEAEEAGKIIHDKAIPYVRMFKTPIEIASIIDPKAKTVISDNKKIKKGAKIVSIKKDLNFILLTDENKKLNEILLPACNIFKKYKINMTLISNTNYSVQIIVDNKNGQLEEAIQELKSEIRNIKNTQASMIYLVGLFTAKDVSNFNDLLVKKGADLLISAFYYEDCYRIEAVIKTDNINKIMSAVYKKFIK